MDKAFERGSCANKGIFYAPHINRESIFRECIDPVLYVQKYFFIFLLLENETGEEYDDGWICNEDIGTVDQTYYCQTKQSNIKYEIILKCQT